LNAGDDLDHGKKKEPLLFPRSRSGKRGAKPSLSRGAGEKRRCDSLFVAGGKKEAPALERGPRGRVWNRCLRNTRGGRGHNNRGKRKGDASTPSNTLGVGANFEFERENKEWPLDNKTKKIPDPLPVI